MDEQIRIEKPRKPNIFDLQRDKPRKPKVLKKLVTIHWDTWRTLNVAKTELNRINPAVKSYDTLINFMFEKMRVEGIPMKEWLAVRQMKREK